MNNSTFKNLSGLLHFLMVLRMQERDRAAAIVLFITKILCQAGRGGAQGNRDAIRANMALIIRGSSRRWSTQTSGRREYLNNRQCTCAF